MAQLQLYLLWCREYTYLVDAVAEAVVELPNKSSQGKLCSLHFQHRQQQQPDEKLIFFLPALEIKNISRAIFASVINVAPRRLLIDFLMVVTKP